PARSSSGSASTAAISRSGSTASASRPSTRGDGRARSRFRSRISDGLVRVGLLHPGEMGATIGNALVAAGHDVLWASEGRSDATRARATAFTDAGSIAGVCTEAEVVFSVVPPHAAVELAASLPEFGAIYVDANAVAPATAARVGELVERFVDGGIIGGPPDPRL